MAISADSALLLNLFILLGHCYGLCRRPAETMFCFAAVFLEITFLERALRVSVSRRKSKDTIYCVTLARKHIVFLGVGPSHRFAQCVPSDFRDRAEGEFRK